VAVDARRHRAELLHAGGGVDGAARRAVMRQRDADPMWAEAARRSGGPAGAVVTLVIACDKRKAFAQGSEAIRYAVPETDCLAVTLAMTETTTAECAAGRGGRRRHWPYASVAEPCSSARRRQRRRACP